MMDKDRMGGIGHQLRGRFMRIAGKLLGDAKLQTDGAREQSEGRAQNAAGCARDGAAEKVALEEVQAAAPLHAAAPSDQSQV